MEEPQSSSMAVDEAPVKAGEADTFHNPDAIIRISTWSKGLSWVVLVLTVVVTVGFVALLYQSRTGLSWMSVVSSLFTVLPVIFMGIFFTVALQILGEGLYVLLDIEDNSRKGK